MPTCSTPTAVEPPCGCGNSSYSPGTVSPRRQKSPPRPLRSPPMVRPHIRLTVNLAKDDRVVSDVEETIVDGDRRHTPCHRLRLEASNDSVICHAIDYWVERGGNRPIKASFPAESDRLMKTAYYRRYEN